MGMRRRELLGGLLAGGLAAQTRPAGGPVGPKERLTITKLETFYVRPRWLFLKVHTDAGMVGLGEPTLEGREQTVAAAVDEFSRALVGKDPRNVLEHWQTMYRGAPPYRGGPVLSSALSGIDQALWDITGKAAGVPVWKLLGGPVRTSIKLYWDVLPGDPPERVTERMEQGFTAFKIAPMEYAGGNARRKPLPPRGTPAYLDVVAENVGDLRAVIGKERDLAFHIGDGTYRTCMDFVRAIERYEPMFFEIHGQNYEYDVMADIARQTRVPIATGEDVYTKWGFRPILMKNAASILQPDCSHAGGITEVMRIAAMADAFDVQIAPHNPLSAIDLAAAVQVAACVPNFFALETSDRGIGHPKMRGWVDSWRGVDILKEPFVVKNGSLDLPQKPGLGIELDENALAKHVTDVPQDR